jgi:hypothetical protein
VLFCYVSTSSSRIAADSNEPHSKSQSTEKIAIMQGKTVARLNPSSVALNTRQASIIEEWQLLKLPICFTRIPIQSSLIFDRCHANFHNHQALFQRNPNMNFSLRFSIKSFVSSSFTKPNFPLRPNDLSYRFSFSSFSSFRKRSPTSNAILCLKLFRSSIHISPETHSQLHLMIAAAIHFMLSIKHSDWLN